MADNQPTPLELTGVEPSELVINSQWDEVKLIVSGFKGKGLSAFIALPIQVSKNGGKVKSKVTQDKFILVEQPEDDAVKEKEFTIQVKVLIGAAEGYRKVILTKSLEDIDDNGACKSKDCKVIDGKLNIKWKP